MSKKTLVILLLALLLVSVLFVVSLILGGRGPDSGLKFNPRSPQLAGIASWLSRPARAEYLTLRSGSPTDCRLENNQIIIKAGATCIYNVSSDPLWTRKLYLLLISPQDAPEGNVIVSLDQPEAKPERTLEPGQTSDSFDIYGRKDSASITLTITTKPLETDRIASSEYVLEIVEK